MSHPLIESIVKERSQLEAINKQLRRDYAGFLNIAAEHERLMHAAQSQAQRTVDMLADNNQRYFNLGTELENLSGDKRIKR